MVTFNDYRPGYHDLFTGYLAREHGWTADYATTITDTALEFLHVCAEHPGERLVASDDIDQAVDTLMLDTELLRWVENFLGHAIVHVPSYAHDPVERMRQDTAYSITIAYMRERGAIDQHIWRDLSDATCTTAGCWTSCRVLAA